MSLAFVDTTVLTDALLKSGIVARDAKLAIKKFTNSQLPFYAIKEFKAGPLTNFSWMHNKLAHLGSFHKALAALHGMSMSPRRYTTSTAIEALQCAAETISKTDLSSLVAKYGAVAKADSILCDEFRLAIKAKIFSAWKKKDRLCTESVLPLDCYLLQAPFEERGMVALKPIKCSPHPECCLGGLLRHRPQDLAKLKKAAEAGQDNRENQRRSKVLGDLGKASKRLMTEQMCRSLGDAYFAFFAPSGAVILTTNSKDHEPLAAALGKAVESSR